MLKLANTPLINLDRERNILPIDVGDSESQRKNRTAEVITLGHLWAGYGTTPILEDINLVVKELDFIGLIGPNGSGKTTLEFFESR